MSNIVNFPNDQATRDEAGAWIAAIDRGLKPGEREALQSWLGTDTHRRKVLFELAELWDGMDVLAEISDLFPLEREVPPPAPVQWYLRPATLSLAALVVAVGLWVNLGRESAPADQVVQAPVRQSLAVAYQTAVGEQRQVTLPDKSVIALNTGTSLRVRYTDTARSIELLQGEAHFEVAKHDGRVFTVHVGDNEFRAVGTAFNVRLDAERGVALMVTEGRVKVVAAAVQTTDAPSAEPLATEIMVDAGKEVILDDAIQTVESVPAEKIEVAMAWRQGQIVLDGDSLEQAIREISRYSSLNFVIAEDSIKRIPVSGYFKVGDVEGLMSALRTNFHISTAQEGDTIVLSAQRP